MASKRNLMIGAGAAVLAVAGVALAAQRSNEANENRIIGEHSEKEIPLNQVPATAMNAARAQLSSVREAELVTRKADGSTLYALEGKDKAGRKIEVYVTPEGRVIGNGPEGDDDEDGD